MSKEQQKWVLIGLIVGAALYAYIFLLYSPLLTKISDQEKALIQKEEALKEAKKQAANYESLKADKKKLELDLNFTMKRLPKTEDQPGLIKELSKITAEKGISILSLEFQKTAAKSFYSEIPIKLSLIGDYNNYGEFLTKLGYSLRMINATDLQFSSSTGNSKGSVNVSAVLKAFVYKDTGQNIDIKEKDASENPVVPLFRYAKYSNKDPFKSLNNTDIKMSSGEVNVDALRLSGVIILGKSSVAIFEDANKATYYLINERFYNKDKVLISNVHGVIGKGNVVLKQEATELIPEKEASYEITQ